MGRGRNVSKKRGKLGMGRGKGEEDRGVKRRINRKYMIVSVRRREKKRKGEEESWKREDGWRNESEEGKKES